MFVSSKPDQTTSSYNHASAHARTCGLFDLNIRYLSVVDYNILWEESKYVSVSVCVCQLKQTP